MAKQEHSIREILFGAIDFFRNYKKIFFLSFLLGIIVSIFYNNTKKPFYKTSAIAISGLDFYENYENQPILDPLLPIEMINFLAEDIRQKNKNELSELLNLPISCIEQLKSIEAKEMYRIDADNRQNPISKFEIEIKVYDQNVVEKVEEGLLFYFTNNTYVKSYYEMYQKRHEAIIDKIDEEISSLMSARSSQLHTADFSSVSITNNRSRSVTQNQIIELYKQKQDYIKEFVLLKPLSFVKSISKPERPEALLWPRVLTITLISLILGFIIAGVKELEKK